MKKNRETLDKIKKILSTKKMFILLVVVSYLFFTVFYMGPSVWRCNTTVYGFGDNTAGPIWKFSLEPKQMPLGGFEKKTNFPVGESTYSPVNYSQSGQSIAIWGLSRTLGPICGYNVFNLVGFVASALVMCGFIYSLTKRKWIAWLAGYAVSFSPYYQMKVGGHPGYGYQALLIGVGWLFFNLLKKQRKRDAFYLGALTAFCFYFDPYFSLLAIIVIAPLVSVWLARGLYFAKKSKQRKADFIKQAKLLFRAGGITLLFLTPLIMITVGNSRQIATSVAANRGNVFFEAKACSNLPHEYAAPFVLNPIFERIMGKEYYVKLADNLHGGFPCGIGEDTVGISLVVLAVGTIGMTIIGWEVINKRRVLQNMEHSRQLVIGGLCLAGFTAVLIGLPPLKGFGIPTPSFVLLHLTTTWRTLTRVFVVVNFVAIFCFSISLVFFSDHFKKYKRFYPLVFLLIFMCIAVEYQAFKPLKGNVLSTFSYSSDVPDAYTWLKEQKSIGTIAEYPLERSGGESNAMAYYLSMQLAHHKVLFNGNVPTSNEEQLRGSLKDISDAQTVSVLGSVGVDAVVIHGVDESVIRKVPGLEVLYVAPQPRFNLLAFTPLVKNDNIVIARVKKDTRKRMIQLADGFPRNANIIRSAADWEYESLNNSTLKIVPIPGSDATNTGESTRVCFSIRHASEGKSSNLKIIIDGSEQDFGGLTSSYRLIDFYAKQNLQLINSDGANMRLSDLGQCSR